MLFHFINCLLITFLFTIALGTLQGISMNNISKPRCPTQCGNVTVPYPFGIGKDTGCSLDDSFHVTCDLTSEDSPQLFLGSSEFEIINISDSELRIKTGVGYRCYHKNGTESSEYNWWNSIFWSKKIKSKNWWESLATFTFSQKNKFTVIGCDDYALITSGDVFSSGCIGLCSEVMDIRDGQCSGKGCCQTSITKGLQNFNVTLDTFRNHTDVWSFNYCGIAFLGEEGSFQFRGVEDLNNSGQVIERIKSTVPVVLDWVIGEGVDCRFAIECQKNSYCYDVDGGGYRCRCNQGYEGNPYLDQGCQGTLQGSNPRAINNSIAKPGCQTHCGDIEVPYPFGIGKDTGCSLDVLFHVTCNLTSEDSPQLFLRSSELEIINIFDSELRIKTGVSFRCYNRSSGTVSGEYNWWTSLPTFTFSEKNKLTLIGCDDYALITGEEGDDFSSGCIGLCSEAVDVADGSCSGNGCCQTSITKGLQFYNVTMQSYRNHTDVWSFNYCGIAFLGEEGSFQFRGVDDLNNSGLVYERIKSTVPVLLDWVIAPDRNCSEATECKENSQCYDVDGGGYRCRCNQGYEGNPYLDCQDINECKDKRNNTCYGDKICINTIGSYYCTCPVGYFGDAKNHFLCLPLAAKHSKVSLIVITLVVGFGTGVLVLAIWMFNYKVVRKRKDKKLREKFFRRNGGLLLQQQLSTGEDAVENTRMFSARDLEKATDRYNENRIVGRGGQGTVYKGMLTDGKIVAVKKSKLVDENQVESFINEVFLLSQISHKNVVKLLGCCLETEVPILVYEFVPNGDLFQFLHDENYDFPTLWSMRLQIATEVAGALAYMHYATSIPIYHRDIKSSNILLDEKFRAKLSDFGISKSVLGDQTHLSTLVKGTHGYIDPEYFQSYQFTEKSDVYSFGIVLVEILTGKKPIFSIGLGESRSLATLILSTEEGLLLENIDNRVLDGPKEQLIAVAKLAKRCLNLNGKLRPTMKEVATKLEGIRSTH